MEEISHGRERPTEKYETIDMRENECSTMWNVQREETRRRARDTVSMLFARRRHVRARTPPLSEHTLTRFPRNNSVSQKNFYIGKNFERFKILNRKIQIDGNNGTVETNIK